MAQGKSKNLILWIGGAGLAYWIFTSAKNAVTNAAAGMPQFLISGFSINKSGGQVTMVIQNPGNQTFNLQSVVGNVLDSGTRIATISFLPGPLNPAIINPASQTTINLKVQIDPVGAAMDLFSSGKQLIADLKSSNTASNANNIITNAGQIIDVTKGFWAQLFSGKDTNTVTETDYGNSESLQQGNATQSDTQDTYAGGDGENGGGDGTYTGYNNNDPYGTGNDGYNDNYGDNYNYGSGDGSEFSTGGDGSDYMIAGIRPGYNVDAGGLAGIGADQHVITINGVVNLSGINIPFNQSITSFNQ